MNWSTDDQQMMSLALALAEKGQYTARPNPMVGCVIVKNGEIIGQGWHQSFGAAHAEINALKQAGNQAEGATCYVSLEPCSHTGKTGPCAQALIDAKVGKVIAAMQDPNPKVAGNGLVLLNQAGIVTECGLLQQQAQQLNQGFINKFIQLRPFVSLKMAMSLDGRTAMADGSSQWITGKTARLDVQRLRARQDAIITGIGTQLADNPSLTVRGDSQTEWFEQLENFKQPNRILLDRQAKASIESKMFLPNAQVWWVADPTIANQKLSQPDHSHLKIIQPTSLTELLKQCAKQGMNKVLIEAGHRLAGAFLEQNLVDEIIIYMAPKIMGDKAMGLFGLDIDNLADSQQFILQDVKRLGDDLKMVYRPK